MSILIPKINGYIGEYHIQGYDFENIELFLEILSKYSDYMKKNKLNDKFHMIINNFKILNEKNINITNDKNLLLNQIIQLDKSFLNFTKKNNNLKDPSYNNYITYINIQLKKLHKINHPLKQKIPISINGHDDYNLQKILNNLSRNEQIELEQNDIILIPLDYYKLIYDFFDKYNIFIKTDIHGEKFIGIHHNINAFIKLLMPNDFISSDNCIFAQDFYSLIKNNDCEYHISKKPLLKKNNLIIK
jgi:hypothetical protein